MDLLNEQNFGGEMPRYDAASGNLNPTWMTSVKASANLPRREPISSELRFRGNIFAGSS
jgi:hypothetical protein